MENQEQYLTDEQLAKNYLVQNDENAFSTLYQRYFNKVYRKCFSYVKNADLASDMAHDVILKSIQKLATFNEKARFSTWLYALTSNYCIDYLRKSKKYNYVSTEALPEMLDEELSLEELQEEEFKYGRINEILDQLSEKERQIIILKYKENLSIKQLQEIYHLKPSAIKMKLKRVKGKILNIYYNRLPLSNLNSNVA